MVSNLLILFLPSASFLLPCLLLQEEASTKAVAFNRQPSIPVSPAASVVRLQWARWPPGLAAHNPNPSRASEPTMQWVGSSWRLSVALPRMGSQMLEALPLTVPVHYSDGLLASLGLGSFQGIDCSVGQSLDTIRCLVPRYPITRSQPSWRAWSQRHVVLSGVQNTVSCQMKLGLVSAPPLSFIQQICTEHPPVHCAGSWW